MRRRILVLLCTASVLIAASTEARAQGGVAFTREEMRRAPDSAAVSRDSLRIRHHTGGRIAAGLGMGVVLGIPGLFSGSDWPNGGLRGYWLGGVVGSAMVSGKRCKFGDRFALSMLGSLPGTALGYLVAKRSYQSRDGAAIASTVVVALSPLVSSAIVLRRCD